MYLPQMNEFFVDVFLQWWIKNVHWHILAPAAVVCDIIIVRRSAHPAGGFFYIIGNAISYYIQKESKKLIRFFDSFIHSILYSNMNSYFLKKSGILIDCSFTRLVGVLGVSMEGDVPPTVLLGTSGSSTVLFTDPILISSFGAACWRTGCLSYAEACPVSVSYTHLTLPTN